MGVYVQAQHAPGNQARQVRNHCLGRHLARGDDGADSRAAAEAPQDRKTSWAIGMIQDHGADGMAQPGLDQFFADNASCKLIHFDQQLHVIAPPWTQTGVFRQGHQGRLQSLALVLVNFANPFEPHTSIEAVNDPGGVKQHGAPVQTRTQCFQQAAPNAPLPECRVNNDEADGSTTLPPEPAHAYANHGALDLRHSPLAHREQSLPVTGTMRPPLCFGKRKSDRQV